MGESVPTKTCRTCGLFKPLEEFYSHPGMADGHLHQCKECKRAQTKFATTASWCASKACSCKIVKTRASGVSVRQ